MNIQIGEKNMAGEKYSIVFSSKTGNTKMLAEAVRETLGEDNLVYFGAPSDEAFEAFEADIIYAGYWTDKGCCDKDSKNFLKKIENKKLFLFGTAGFGTDEAYFDKVIGKTKECLSSSVTLIGTYMCQGKMPMSVRERYEKMRKIPGLPMDVDKMIANFDMALSHPDENDLEKLKEQIGIIN